MSSELEIKRAFYPPGFKCKYLLRLQSSVPFLSELTDFVLRRLLPPSIWSTGELLDIKGVDPLAGRAASSLGPAQISPPGNASPATLLIVQGVLLYSVDPTEEDSEMEAIPFEVRLDTEFSAFQGFSHIRHKISTGMPDNFPNFIKVRDLGRLFPLEIRYLYCGMELFRPRRFSSLLAFTPTATQSMILEASSGKFALEINAHSLASREELPLLQESILSKLSEFLIKQTSFNLLADYSDRARNSSN